MLLNGDAGLGDILGDPVKIGERALLNIFIKANNMSGGRRSSFLSNRDGKGLLQALWVRGHLSALLLAVVQTRMQLKVNFNLFNTKCLGLLEDTEFEAFHQGAFW